MVAMGTKGLKSALLRLASLGRCQLGSIQVSLHGNGICCSGAVYDEVGSDFYSLFENHQAELVASLGKRNVLGDASERGRPWRRVRNVYRHQRRDGPNLEGPRDRRQS